MKIFFIDQSGQSGGAELCLADIAHMFKSSCLVGLMQDGPFKSLLEHQEVRVQVLTTQPLEVRKESGLVTGLKSLQQLLPLIVKAAQIANSYDLIYANTPKALVVAALASVLSGRPVIYHLHDIISPEHFSTTNRRLLIFLANRFASLIIANSKASLDAFIEAGGEAYKTSVVYNGFNPEAYQVEAATRDRVRQSLQLQNKFVIGHFSRFSPWKGQDVLIQALTRCPDDAVVLLVGDALFGEKEYSTYLHQLVNDLNLQHRVHFLGFRSDVAELMHACDLITHTSTAPEPFGRVIVEAMLCQKPVIAAAAGGATELVEEGKTGWLCPPKQPQKLANLIFYCYQNQEKTTAIGKVAQAYAVEAFSLNATNSKIKKLLQEVLPKPTQEG